MSYIDVDKFAEKICNFQAIDEDAANAMIWLLRTFPTADVVEIPEGGMGNLSDGYHTFNELYHHRAILFSAICNSMPDKAWKSKLHDTGDMYDGMFIVGIETPEGQATYHYDIEPYWDMFKVKELEKAPKWDGHTPQDAIDRISKLSADVVEVRHGRIKWVNRPISAQYATVMNEHGEKHYGKVCDTIENNPVGYCGECGKRLDDTFMNFCPNCGAKMDDERSENGT